MTKQINTLPIFDIHTAAFLELNGNPAILVLQGTRVIFEFPNNDKTSGLLRKYQDNPSIPLLNYVSALRKLRSHMLSVRDDVKGNTAP